MYDEYVMHIDVCVIICSLMPVCPYVVDQQGAEFVVQNNESIDSLETLVAHMERSRIVASGKDGNKKEKYITFYVHRPKCKCSIRFKQLTNLVTRNTIYLVQRNL